MTDNLSNRSAQALTLVPANTLSSFASKFLAFARTRAPKNDRTATSGSARFDLENLENRVMLTASPVGPTIESLVASPYVVTGAGGQGTGATFSLTATNVQDADGDVANVRFYQDSNDNGVLDVYDTLVALGKKSGNNWSADISHEGFATTQYFAQASDANGRNSSLASAVVTFPALGIDKVSASVSANKVKLTAVKVSGASNVEFYRDTNENGIIDDGDTLMGVGKKVGKNWQLIAPVTNEVQPFARGSKHVKNTTAPLTFMIRAISEDGNTGTTHVVHTKSH